MPRTTRRSFTRPSSSNACSSTSRTAPTPCLSGSSPLTFSNAGLFPVYPYPRSRPRHSSLSPWRSQTHSSSSSCSSHSNSQYTNAKRLKPPLSTTEASLTHMLRCYPILVSLVSAMHYADFRSLMATSKGVRGAILEGCDWQRIRWRTCGGNSWSLLPVTCWACGVPICGDCSKLSHLPPTRKPTYTPIKYYSYSRFSRPPPPALDLRSIIPARYHNRMATTPDDPYPPVQTAIWEPAVVYPPSPFPPLSGPPIPAPNKSSIIDTVAPATPSSGARSRYVLNHRRITSISRQTQGQFNTNTDIRSPKRDYDFWEPVLCCEVCAKMDGKDVKKAGAERGRYPMQSLWSMSMSTSFGCSFQPAAGPAMWIR